MGRPASSMTPAVFNPLLTEGPDHERPDPVVADAADPRGVAAEAPHPDRDVQLGPADAEREGRAGRERRRSPAVSRPSASPTVHSRPTVAAPGAGWAID